MAQKTVILVVEDEVIIRMGAVALLEDAGFAVLEAGNAHDAVAILEGRNDIRAIFTDVNMPGTMDGMKLARMVRGRWPPIHLIVTSGLVAAERDLPHGGRFIRKPYDPEQVVAAVRELLGAAPPSRPARQGRRAA